MFHYHDLNIKPKKQKNGNKEVNFIKNTNDTSITTLGYIVHILVIISRHK